MYNEGAGVAIGGSGVTAGALAVTGISVMGMAIVALIVIVTGILMVRVATVGQEEVAEPASVRTPNRYTALATAVMATIGDEV